MLEKLKVYVFLSVILSVHCEEGEQYWKIVEKNGLSFRVLYDTNFNLDYNISVLRIGSVADLPEMNSLLIYETGLREIEPGAFGNLPNLGSLGIAICNIEEIKAGVFNALEISDLEVTRCKVRKIDPKAFDDMTKLRSIRLDDNRLTSWDPNWFVKTPILRNIFINNNSLEEIPAKVVKNLKTLNCVSMFDNKIRKINDDAFNGVIEMELLQLQSNELETLNGNFLRGIDITEFRVGNNRIQCLVEDDWEKIFVAYVTDIVNNPWDPECLKKIKKWVKANHKGVVFK